MGKDGILAETSPLNQENFLIQISSLITGLKTHLLFTPIIYAVWSDYALFTCTDLCCCHLRSGQIVVCLPVQLRFPVCAASTVQKLIIYLAS